MTNLPAAELSCLLMQDYFLAEMQFINVKQLKCYKIPQVLFAAFGPFSA